MSNTITVDTLNLGKIVVQLGAAGVEMRRVQSAAINTVTARTFTRAKREIKAGYNLKASYISERMSTSKAAPSRLAATISARVRHTTLSTYAGKQLTKPAKRAKGDPLRKIQPGRKQAGIGVTVKPGISRQMPGAFFLPMRAGNVSGGNGFGVFIRIGPGEKDIEHHYGPSVHQIFTGVSRRIRDDVETDLAAETTRYALVLIKKALSP